MKQTGTLALDDATAFGDGPSWADQLRAVGTLLDQEPGAVRDACVLAVDGGFVVEAVTESLPTAGDETPGRIPLSREYTTDDIAAAQSSQSWIRRTRARRQR